MVLSELVGDRKNPRLFAVVGLIDVFEKFRT